MPNKSNIHADRCCNPFQAVGHKGKYLRNVSENLKRKFPDIDDNAKICNECRKKSKDASINRTPSDASENVLDANQMDVDQDQNVSAQLNETSSSLNPEDVRSKREIELENLLSDLKEKFQTLSRHNPMQLKILTVTPKSWSAKKISKEFNCSWQFAKKAKDLRDPKGILPETTSKVGKLLPESTVQKILDFYNSDENGRIMPGRKDVISVKNENGRCLMQKRLLLLDLRGLFLKFKESYPDCPISFSKFAQLRPKHCILAGGSGTHCVCVCTIHQNCKLMLDAINIEKLTKNSEKSICSYKDCLQQITCSNPSEECSLGECAKCPDISEFMLYLQKLLEEQNFYDVQFSSWSGTDRSTLQTQILPTVEFLEELNKKLLLLKPHSFISKEQSQYFTEKK